MDNKKRKIIVLQTSGELSDHALKKWEEISRSAIKGKGFFTAALSGGKTPVPFFRKLARSKRSLPWGRTHIFMVDERFVPYGDKANNYRHLHAALLSTADIPMHNVHAIATESITSRASAKRYEEEIASFFKLRPGRFPSFDLILLGIGEDGHTASLFPGAASLRKTGRLAIAVPSPDMPDKERITLTLPVINNSKNIIFMVTGRSKAGVVRELIEKRNNALPASRVTTKKGMILYLMDRGAASQLSQREKSGIIS